MGFSCIKRKRVRARFEVLTAGNIMITSLLIVALCCLVDKDKLVGIFLLSFYPEDGDSRFFQHVGTLCYTTQRHIPRGNTNMFTGLSPIFT
jgi:hypothetical protein